MYHHWKTIEIIIFSKQFTYLSIVLLRVLFEEPCTAISKTAFCPVKMKQILQHGKKH